MSFIEFLLIAFGLLGATFVGLGIARHYRERRDEALTASSGGWRIRSQLPMSPGSPYNRFDLTFDMAHDAMEGRDEGFDVAYFWAYAPFARKERYGDAPWACAIVELPVDPPAFAMHEDERVPVGVGARTAAVLETVDEVGDHGGMEIRTAPLALLVRFQRASRETVERTALALAKAIVADAAGQSLPNEHSRPR